MNKKTKKVILISAICVSVIAILISIIILFSNKIPSKYYGTFTRYYYFNNKEYKETYKISALSIKHINEDGNKKIIQKIKYNKKSNDIIIKEGDNESYLIIDDDCLYIESNKDISISKKNKSFYWNEKSDKADIYEIENKSEKTINLIEDTMNTWARKTIYNSTDQEMNNSNFYIFNSDEESNKTDLNTYEVKLNAAGGDLSLYYNRKTKDLKRISYHGKIFVTSLEGKSAGSIDIKDIFDFKAMILSFIYILGNEDNIELNQETVNENNASDYIIDTSYRIKATEEYNKLLESKMIDNDYNDRFIYSLNNDKYSIEYIDWISTGSYSIIGTISFSISLKY